MTQAEGPGPGPGTALSSASLGMLDPRVAVPRYDRAALREGIVHIGVGGFHRAHQAVFLDDLCVAGQTDWSITGAGVLPSDASMAAALGAQDHLYTLVTRDRAATSVRVIGSIVDYVLASPGIDPLVARLARPASRVVSLTITEGGYPVDEATGELALAPGQGLPPAFESIARALSIRRDQGLGGFTVLSCDNILHNGATARTATLGVAALIEPGLEAWVDRNVGFPNGMVDRITPATTDGDRRTLAEEFGVADRWPVMTEPFIQWVIEDTFPSGRPPWEDAGVLFTTDVGPYETLKLRLLNAGHSCLAYLAALAGHTYVHEVMADPPFERFLRRFHADEAVASLPPVRGIDITRYTAQVAERFANPQVRDQVSRICLDGTAKFPKFLIPTIESQLDSGGPASLAALALAGWCQYLLGTDDRGRPLTVASDPGLRRARSFAEASRSEPRAFLGLTEVFGERVAADPVFVPAFATALMSLRENGVYPTMDRWLRGGA